SDELKTNPVTDQTSEVSGTETKTVFKSTNPENVLMKIKFEAGCPIGGSLNIKAEKLTTTDPMGSEEAVEQELRINSMTELKIGANAATLTGSVKIHLSLGSLWSFHGAAAESVALPT